MYLHSINYALFRNWRKDKTTMKSKYPVGSQGGYRMDQGNGLYVP